MSVFFILITGLILAIIVHIIFALINPAFVERLQTFAPVWVPRNLLFGCEQCFGFWFAVPFAVGLWLYFHDIYLILLPFVTSTWVKFVHDMQQIINDYRRKIF